jgi:hypothetical protein
MKLTTTEIARYQPPADKRDHIIFDETLPGFGLRYRGGKRIWLFQYARGSGAGRLNRRLHFGDFPNLWPPRRDQLLPSWRPECA